MIRFLKLSSLIAVIIFLSFSSMAQDTSDGVVNPTGPTTGAAEAITDGEVASGDASTEEQQVQPQSCVDSNQAVIDRCTHTQELSTAYQNSSWFNRRQQGEEAAGTTGTTAQTIRMGRTTRAALRQAVAECQNAGTVCDRMCSSEINAARTTTPPNTAHMELATTTRNECTQRVEQIIAEVQPRMMELDRIIELALRAWEILRGLKGDGSDSDGFATSSNNEDLCNSEYNANGTLVGCQDAINGSRATGGLTGTSLGGLNGNVGSVGATSEMGEPGGTNSGNTSPNSGTFNPNGFGGFASFGTSGSGVGTSGAGTAGGAQGLDTDIHKGFMSADGGGAGGGDFSGGGSAPAPRPGAFSQSSLGGASGAAQKAALQRQLSRYANKEKRGLASTGDTNGPFQDNWTVINKAYKKNSNTMYHQK